MGRACCCRDRATTSYDYAFRPGRFHHPKFAEREFVLMAAIGITAYRDKTNPYDIVVTKKDGTVQPLAGTVLWFHAAVAGIDITKNSPDNGVTIVDFTDSAQKFSDGVIGLQIHTGGGVKMRWKDISLREE